MPATGFKDFVAVFVICYPFILICVFIDPKITGMRIHRTGGSFVKVQLPDAVLLERLDTISILM